MIRFGQGVDDYPPVRFFTLVIDLSSDLYLSSLSVLLSHINGTTESGPANTRRAVL